MSSAKQTKNRGKYGPGIVGKDAYKAQEASEVARVDKYGPGILGVEEYARLTGDGPQEATEGPKEEKKAVSTPPEEDPALQALVSKYATDDGYLAIKDVKSILKEMPNAFDRVLAWELGRKDGPRVGALQHLLELEGKREGGARAPVFQHIEMSLAKARGG